MKDKFLDFFSDREICIFEILKEHTFIYEDEISKKGKFVEANEKYHVHIQKKNTSDINCHFVQNDDCVMINYIGGQCDYVFFNEKDIHFVEVKGTHQNLKVHKKKLYNQLENTFKFYQSFLGLFTNKFALVCFESVNSRGYIKRRIPQSSKSEKNKLFKRNYGINLLEGNYIKFE
ncbi:hypothetical protein HZQ12_10450 [Elizabethkingia anophelis]|uniref:hypothetical protein n=1 Tax=Elizabethkingia anophelis TaxID=1117645 RepID=UPI0021A6EF72|nr:hypothetical protein [Elizabethkingia anophelis]MCT3977323.1 hypothetical protein [Elizabethkingia anophelis]MCT4040799.1 hypothetical protein [Elizabethkingia anophelis]MDV3864920.1 hypothetical protein [Elizabethkingia anophelis]